jgi:hypothetical protein
MSDCFITCETKPCDIVFPKGTKCRELEKKLRPNADGISDWKHVEFGNGGSTIRSDGKWCKKYATEKRFLHGAIVAVRTLGYATVELLFP